MRRPVKCSPRTQLVENVTMTTKEMVIKVRECFRRKGDQSVPKMAKDEMT
jgi:hypothetical protein